MKITNKKIDILSYTFINIMSCLYFYNYNNKEKVYVTYSFRWLVWFQFNSSFLLYIVFFCYSIIYVLLLMKLCFFYSVLCGNINDNTQIIAVGQDFVVVVVVYICLLSLLIKH